MTKSCTLGKLNGILLSSTSGFAMLKVLTFSVRPILLLCAPDQGHNATRVRALKGRLESEYRMQEKLLKDAHSKGLHLRSTRCDEIDLVKATYCPRRVACE